MGRAHMEHYVDHIKSPYGPLDKPHNEALGRARVEHWVGQAYGALDRPHTKNWTKHAWSFLWSLYEAFYKIKAFYGWLQSSLFIPSWHVKSPSVGSLILLSSVNGQHETRQDASVCWWRRERTLGKIGPSSGREEVVFLASIFCRHRHTGLCWQ